MIVAWKLDGEQTFTERDLDAFSSMIAVNRYFNGDVAHVWWEEAMTPRLSWFKTRSGLTSWLHSTDTSYRLLDYQHLLVMVSLPLSTVRRLFSNVQKKTGKGWIKERLTIIPNVGSSHVKTRRALARHSEALATRSWFCLEYMSKMYLCGFYGRLRVTNWRNS